MNLMTLKERKMEDIFEAISDTQQRSEEWHEQRMGKFTASRFGDLMTNGRKKDEVLGQTAISYIYEKAAELLTGQRTEIFGKALDWGNEYEPICKAYYSELRGVTIEEMPFVEINDYSGASPDGMIDGELIEIKCPYNTANHLKTAFEGYIDPKYLWQMQGQMLATGATACRFISFDPRIKDERFKLIEIRVEADLEMQQQLRERLAFANDYLRKLLEQ
jgi:putative phage-type endonuclease